jgi:hypothetical protein
MFTLDTVEDLIDALREIGSRHELCNNHQEGKPHKDCTYDKDKLNAAWRKKATVWIEFGRYPLAVRWLIRDQLCIATADDVRAALLPFFDKTGLKGVNDLLKGVDDETLLGMLDFLFDHLDREDVRQGRFLMLLWRRMGLRCSTVESLLPFGSSFLDPANALRLTA